MITAFSRAAKARPATPVSFVFAAAGDRKLLKAGLGFAFDAIRFFFLPQFANSFVRTRPVVSVDHPIDDEIPFRGGLVGTYLGFIQYWMDTALRLKRAYGDDAGVDGMVRDLAKLYRDAGKVYLRCHSTTRRPARFEDLRFAIIHLFDPHMNCVPSLHVTLVYATWALARALVLDRGGDADEAAVDWLEKLYDRGVRITESILFLKQHSVNCVGASFFYLNAEYPKLFDDERCERFMRDLFTREGSDLAARDRARERMVDLYRELKADAASRPGESWDATVLRFLERYGRENGSLNTPIKP